MKNLIKMLRELDIDKNNKENIKSVLLFIADNLENKQKDIISFIKETKEYYHDGIDEEIIDMLK